jgi:hypothetical protein
MTNKITKKNSVSKRMEIIEKIKVILETSSVHGVPNIVRNKNNLIKLVWVFFFLASSGICGWFVIDIVAKYSKYEVVSKIVVRKERKLAFPIVFICDDFGSKHIVRQDERIMRAEFDYSELSLEKEFKKNDISSLNCFRFNSRESLKYVHDRSTLAFLKLELFIGSMQKSKGSDKYGMILRIVDENQSSGSSIDNIYIQPGTFNKILVHKSVIKRQAFPYSECVSDLNSKVK